MILTVLCFGCAVFASVSAVCTRSTSCPCGSSSRNYTFCIDDTPTTNETCNRWDHCQTCQDGVSSCLTCPPGHYGPTCSEVTELKKIRKKRQSAWSDGSFQIGSCPPISAPTSGLIRCRQATRRGSCRGKCKSGYTFEDHEDEPQIILECRRTGWHPLESFPPCIEGFIRSDCPDPGVSSELVRHPPARSYPGTFEEYELVSFSCTDERAVIEGESSIECRADGSWSAPVPRCVIPKDRPCSFPGVDSNGQVFVLSGSAGQLDTNQLLPPGTRLVYSCNDGYDRFGAESITCQPSGNWTKFYPYCLVKPTDTGIYCPNPGPIANGQIDESAPPVVRDGNSVYLAGTILSYTCGIGHVIHGSEEQLCEESGKWSAKQPWCIVVCGVSTLEASRRITHGIETLSGEWPWVVSISISRNNGSGMICGGALLNRRTVLTAAHCFGSPPDPYYILHFGKYYRLLSRDDDQVEVRRSSRVILHSNYNKDTFENDIALIQFYPTVDYSKRILPICLPTSDSTEVNVVPGKIGYVAGWGIDHDDLRPDVLMMAKLPVQSDGTCMSSFREQNLDFQIVRGMFCAGHPEGGMSTCRGDSGGTLVFYDEETERYTAEGIVSFSVRGSCGARNRFTVFTKVREYVSWIRKNWRN